MNMNERIEIRDRLVSSFPGIHFDEASHTYTIEGEKYLSVSSLLKHFYDEFDSDDISKMYAKKRGFRVDQVLDAWAGNSKIATDKGHRVHLFAEDYANWRYFGIGTEPRVQCKQTLAVVEFFNSLTESVTVAATELQMYHKEWGSSGTADLPLHLTQSDKYIVSDWKTNSELFDESKPLLHYIDPSFGLRQDNYGKYCLQFSFYQLYMESKGFEVYDRVLIWLNEDKENKKLYRTFRTPDLTQELLKYKHIWAPRLNGKMK